MSKTSKRFLERLKEIEIEDTLLDEQLYQQADYIKQLINPPFKIDKVGGWSYPDSCDSCTAIAWSITIFQEKNIYMGIEGEILFVCPTCGIIFRIPGVD